MGEEKKERKKMEEAFVGIKGVKGQSQMQGWSFLPPEAQDSYFTIAWGPQRPVLKEPGSLPMFPAAHLSEGCFQCSAGGWGSLQETPSHVFYRSNLYGTIGVPLVCEAHEHKDLPKCVKAARKP